MVVNESGISHGIGPLDFSAYLQDLAALIAMESVSGHAQGNADVVAFLQQRLAAIGFEVEVHGAAQTDQPLMIARRVKDSGPVLVMYNHYDVEAIAESEQWLSAPFTLTARDERLWARGIADNKAVLLARLAVLEARIQQGEPLPDLVWLIQGEEEVGSPVAHELMPDILGSLNAFICLEETGYVRDGVPLIFYREPTTEAESGLAADELLSSLNSALYAGAGRCENRTLSKFGPCPMVSNLPAAALYLGFGPNDYQARIHRDNESMSQALLQQYFSVFDVFLDWTINTIALTGICSGTGNECVA
ncbi:M20/M25/M40 family metallo-hydrolase [Thalassolituus hydrocarboniclasticus]|uniref:M20/M25/M40 family metallo-hydrolase n=1 Tax=Thalassolituus hydrocarboniclasticus TaxID=2742796 RepID=A0ABY6ABA3_9GAMM|nr:M20/M25/M40 family metallo-hydrolase [Thalassolituus hydrocarboniclasticus]UXD87719.1 M20/M25/M40 family metallo-hydrolase [Thalassolituus hydrocarboniclasticus]